MYKFIVPVMLLFFISCCQKEEPVVLPKGKGVYIMNEGNFNFSNGEISFYNPDTKEVSDNLFQASNGFSLGDVVQSMPVKDSIGFIVVNNSHKIEVVRIPSLQKIRTIDIAGSSPRYFLPVNDSLALVTELYAPKIWVINYLTGLVVRTITTTGWTENMVMIDNSVYVQQKKVFGMGSTSAALLQVNLNTFSVQHAVSFNGRDVNGIVRDKFNRIWVAVDEDSAQSLPAGFYCFDRNLMEQKSFFYSHYNHHPSRLCADSKKEQLYFADQDIFRFSINDNALPVSAFIAASGKNIYSLDIHPATDEVYFSDAIDFVQRSMIYRYDKQGLFIHSFHAGVISGNFSFVYE
ncbi:MAG: hypothetical protein U0T74_11090 [Chitinophagales bacterium]